MRLLQFISLNLETVHKVHQKQENGQDRKERLNVVKQK